MSASENTISPMVLNTIQTEFLKHIGHIFDSAKENAITIFITLAIIELVIFGIIWAMRAENVFMEFIFKVIKLSVIFSVITYFPAIASGLLDNVTALANKIYHTSEATKIILNPGFIWQYGFDASISLLKAATSNATPIASQVSHVASSTAARAASSSGGGISTLYYLLGFGSLFLFCLIGAQIIVIMCGFYLVSLASLFLIPFGALVVMKDLFNQAITNLIKLAVKVMVLVIIMSIAIKIWSQFDLKSISSSTTIDQPLGLFFSTLVICILVYSLPKIVANTVGHVGSDIFANIAPPNPSTNVTTSPASINVSNNSSPRSAAAAGTKISSITAGSSTTSTSSASGSASQLSPTGASGKASDIFGGANKKQTQAAVNLSKSSIQQLKSSLKKHS